MSRDVSPEQKREALTKRLAAALVVASELTEYAAPDSPALAAAWARVVRLEGQLKRL